MRRNRGIKVGILIAVIGLVCFSNGSFAYQETHEALGSIGWVTDFVVSVLSWIWIIFAKIAGELLTNNWVYGEVLGLDALLWQYWNVMKNIANFGLGFYFVYVILIGLIGKESIEKKIKPIIGRMLVAGIGIQASWFITAAVIDVSTITLVAAGSFPSQVLASNAQLERSMKYSMNDTLDPNRTSVVKGYEVKIFSPDSQANSLINTIKQKLEKPLTVEQFVDAMLPNADTISGPLYYLGFGILDANLVNSIDTSSDDGLKNTILNLVIQGGTTIIYSIELGVLCVLALMRIIYLWMFIVLSPIAILLFCIDKSGIIKSSGKDGKGFLGGLTKQINLKSFIINVFKPTIIVFCIGLAMLFASLMKGVLLDDTTGRMKDPVDLGGVIISSTPDNTTIGDSNITYTTTMSNSMFKISLMHIGKGFLDFILSLITVILVYIIISVAVKMGGGKDFVSEKIGKVQDAVKGAMTSLPVMPVAGYDKDGVKSTRYISAAGVFGLGGKESILEKKIGYYQDKVNEEYRKQDAIVHSWLTKQNVEVLTAENRRAIEGAGDNTTGISRLDEKIKEINKIRNQNKLQDGQGYGMRLSDEWWAKQFTTRLSDTKNVIPDNLPSEDWKKMVKAWRGLDSDKQNLKTLFDSDTRYVNAYADKFGLKDVKGWDDLKDRDISANNIPLTQ